MKPLTVNFSCESPATNQQVIDRLNELEKLIYNAIFRVVMTDTLSYYVPFTTHKNSFIRGITVLNPDGFEVRTSNLIDAGKNITINSNVSLEDSILIIF